MKKINILSIIILIFAHINIASAEIPQTVNVDGQELQLNGVGQRTKFFFDIYEGALYTSEKARSLAEVIATGKNVRIAMHIQYREVGGEKLRNGFQEGFEENMSAEELKTFASEITAFKEAWKTMFKNNIANIDFTTNGLTVTTQDGLRGTISNPKFNEMVFRIWLGKEPAQEGLKEGMLGLN